MIKQFWCKPLPWIRLIITIAAALLIAFCVGLILYGNNSSSNDIAFGILAGIAAFFAAGQWFFPFSSKKSENVLFPLAGELVRASFKMGDEKAANFPYVSKPIQNIYNDAKQVLLESSTGVSNKRGILVIGEANAGKTRLAFEALTQTLPNWPVLRWRPDYTVDKVQTEEFLTQKKLVVFIDDLQDYVPAQTKDIDANAIDANLRTITLQTLLQILLQHLQNVVIVATCRLEDEMRVRVGLNEMFTKLAAVSLQHFNKDIRDPETVKILADFQIHGPINAKDWDGTLGSLVLGLSTKNSQYLALVERQAPASVVLRAMKLLKEAGINIHRELLLQNVCSNVFGEKKLLEDQRSWQETISQLTQLQFVEEELDEANDDLILSIRQDSYFDKVITDYPYPSRPHRIDQDFIQLQEVLVKLGDIDSLFSLGVTYALQGRQEKAFEPWRYTLTLPPTNAFWWHMRGFALGHQERHEEALEAFDQALTLNPQQAQARYLKSVLFYFLERYEEALEIIIQASSLDFDHALNTELAHVFKGHILFALKRYEEALEAFDQALVIKPNQADVWYVKGFAFSELEQYERSLQAFDQVLALTPKHIGAYYQKGTILMKLNRYEEALVTFEQIIHLDPDNASALANKVKLLRVLGHEKEAQITEAQMEKSQNQTWEAGAKGI